MGGNMMRNTLRDFTNEELLECLEKNQTMELSRLPGICSEILRRMNQQKPLLKDEEAKRHLSGG